MYENLEGCWCCKKRNVCFVDVEKCFNYEVDKELLKEEDDV